MHKITQKVASAALAVSMLFSMFSVNVVAFADEFQDDTTVSDDAAGTLAMLLLPFPMTKTKHRKIKKIYIYVLTPLANGIELKM